MANLGNQVIQITLFGDSVEPIPNHVQSYLYVPHHIHNHNELSGRFDVDAHPQYLTEALAGALFIELSKQLSDPTVGNNLGSGAGVYAQKTGFCLEFKSIVEGNNVTIVENNDTITINSVGGGDSFGGTY